MVTLSAPARRSIWEDEGVRTDEEILAAMESGRVTRLERRVQEAEEKAQSAREELLVLRTHLDQLYTIAQWVGGIVGAPLMLWIGRLALNALRRQGPVEVAGNG